ncbi:hypothetical protein [Aeromonas hydrophila]|uniref:hypothetical protein n=1 Tax=Aeromonas hydrophila TaxID=644 RepID=UPI002B49CE7D|nr:hypothetical protein [Aeromonas hydrophila]
MLFDSEFIEHVLDNPYVGIHDACKRIEYKMEVISDPDSWTEEEHEVLWEGASFIHLVIQEKGHDDEGLNFPEVTSNINENCVKLKSYLGEVQKKYNRYLLKDKISEYTQRYNDVFKKVFAYEFSQGDLERVQLLINELRSHISESNSLEQKHRQRLLKRLEHLQSELHKRISDLDRFWGLVGDAGVVLGKLGTDAKPIVDRIKEIAEIAWKTQARAEELPSSSSNPMLGKSE